MRCLGGIIDSVDMSLSRLWGMVKDREACMLHGQACCSPWGCKELGTSELLNSSNRSKGARGGRIWQGPELRNGSAVSPASSAAAARGLGE